MTKLLVEGREQGIARLVDAAEEVNAEPRSSRCASIPPSSGSNVTEICAYGTAVRARKL